MLVQAYYFHFLSKENSNYALLPGKLNFYESTKLARNLPFAANKRKHRIFTYHKSLKSSEFRSDKTVKATYNSL